MWLFDTPSHWFPHYLKGVAWAALSSVWLFQTHSCENLDPADKATKTERLLSPGCQEREAGVWSAFLDLRSRTLPLSVTSTSVPGGMSSPGLRLLSSLPASPSLPELQHELQAQPLLACLPPVQALLLRPVFLQRSGLPAAQNYGLQGVRESTPDIIMSVHADRHAKL